jgi:hypothetical protein
MAKQSNLSQRIVYALYQAISPVGGTVTESAQLHETTSGIPREVDILAEARLFGTCVRVAIEVRGRGKKQDVLWIDELIGKYRDLPVDKIIAVSSAGFSEAALKKAATAGIELISALDAESRDWPNEFKRIGIGMVTRSDRVEVIIRSEPPGRRDFTRESRITTVDGTDVDSLGELIDAIGKRHRTLVSAHLATRFLDYYKTLDDLKKVLQTDDIVKLPETLWVQARDGDRVRIAKVGVRAWSTMTVGKVSARHTMLGGHLVSSAQMDKADGSSVELFAIQSSDHPGKVNVRISTQANKKTRTEKVRDSKVVR